MVERRQRPDQISLRLGELELRARSFGQGLDDLHEQVANIEARITTQDEVLNALTLRSQPGPLRRFFSKGPVLALMGTLLFAGMSFAITKSLSLHDQERQINDLSHAMPVIGKNLEHMAAAIDNLCNVLARRLDHSSDADPRCERLELDPMPTARFP